MKNKAFSIIVGLIIVGIGIGYGLQALNYIDHFTVFIKGWWTIFIIVPGLVMLFTRGANKFVSLCLIALGAALFLHQQNILGDFKKYVIPALIIIFGLSIIINAFVGGRKKNNTSFFIYKHLIF